MTPEEGYQEVLRRIEEARRTEALELDLTGLRLNSIPEELILCRDLQKLKLGYVDLGYAQLNNNFISQIEHLPSGLKMLYVLNMPLRQIENLPSGLQTLELISCRINQIKNLPEGLQTLELHFCGIEQIENLPAGLQTLNLSSNQIRVLRNLPLRLKTLDLSYNQISRIENLPQGLQSLNLKNNQISRIENLSTDLQILNLCENRLIRIENLPDGLLTLDLGQNNITRVENLPENIRNLELWGNRISKIENLPLELLTLELSFNVQINELENLPKGLLELRIIQTRISKIKNLPEGLRLLKLGSRINKIENLPNRLEVLDLNYNQISKIENIPQKLQELYLWQNPTVNIPTELLGDFGEYNCLHNVRAWFADLEEESVPNRTVKFIVSGNSNVGKSSLLEALRIGKAQPGQDSTHGIRIESLPLTDGVQQIDGIAFDFGGQEIYHGTHQLFLRSRAVQIVVFDAETESITVSLDRQGKQGEINRNKSLPNWLYDLRRQSPNSAFVLAQNKLELSASLATETQTRIQLMDTKQEVWTVRVSALAGRYINALRGILAEAAQSLPEYGMLMPSSWIAVRNYFLENIQKVVFDRQRVVSRDFFHQLCVDCNVLSGSEDALLRYLHNTGVVYYDETYLKDTIIADQQWAIEAIYQVLDRQGRLYDELANETFGKKRLKYLFGYFDSGYTAYELRLFINLMESCGLCFPLKEQYYSQVNDDTYYLFPQFLSNERPDFVTDFQVTREDRIIYQLSTTFLPYYHIQQLIVRWGVKTDVRNIWRTGFLVHLPNEGRFVLEADLVTNTLMLTIDRAVPAETVARLLNELKFGNQETEWKSGEEKVILVSETRLSNSPEQPLVDTIPNIVQPKIRRLVVSYAKEDSRYVDLLRKKMAARKTIDLWYDRHIDGWSDWDGQIKQNFTDCDGYIIFLSDTYMDAETKTYIHEKEIPLMLQRFEAGQAYVSVINVTSYNTHHTDLAPFLSFQKAALMPDPDKQAIEASQFLEAFVNEKLFGEFLKPSL